ncbi:protein associated with UVRAG as autophagy enhancer [Carettochelys insculpta]|uniref:protein associated with UVRAG as autophagy enhancer n=1 Tax=Carettochelys insculpta TaxID=44489 RepID=UPI003EBF11E9
MQDAGNGYNRRVSQSVVQPIVLVPKPDGTTHFCNDFRRLSHISQFDAYLIPRIDELVDRLGTARYLTTLDLTKGYWQIPLAEDAKEKTAFATPEGLFQYTGLSFGLHGAPATFQHRMDKLLRPHTRYAAAYLDDVVIHTPDWESHLGRVEAVLDTFRRTGLTANLAKCAVGFTEPRTWGDELSWGRPTSSHHSHTRTDSIFKTQRTTQSNQGWQIRAIKKRQSVSATCPACKRGPRGRLGPGIFSPTVGQAGGDSFAPPREQSEVRAGRSGLVPAAAPSLSGRRLWRQLVAPPHSARLLPALQTGGAQAPEPRAGQGGRRAADSIGGATDEYSRPAVVGRARSLSSFLCSAAAIEEILNASGVKPSSLPERTVLQTTEDPDSDMERWEENSNGDSNNYSGIDYTHRNIGSTQMDIRFMRHKASWDNTQCNSKSLTDSLSCPSYSGRSPLASALNSLSCSEMAPRKCDCFTQVTLTGGTVTSLANSIVCSGKELTNSSRSPDQPLTHKGIAPDLTANEQTPPVRNCKTSAPTPLGVEDGNSAFHPCSQSAPSDQQGATSALSIGTASLNRSLKDIFMLPVDVEKENAHFFVADMIIASLEKMKCSILSQQEEPWHEVESSGSLGSYRTDSEISDYTRVKTLSASSASSDSGCEGCAVLQIGSSVKPPVHHEANRFHSESDSDDEFVIIEFEDLENIAASPDERLSSNPGCNSAEVTAQKLYRAFRKCWLQTEADAQLSCCLNTTKQKFANKENIPKEFESSGKLAEEIKVKSQLRGTTDWAPPQFQIIFSIHPSLKREAVVASQNFTCAGCGTPIELKYIRRLRYCDYLGRYFCDCCHSYAQSYIPARILMKWDFKKYYVCNFSKHLLHSIWQNPIFNVLCINRTLYTKAKELNRVREIQEQLLHIKKLLNTCRFAGSILKEFEQVSRHLTTELHLFSMDDLVKIKRGVLMPLLRDILKNSTFHVENCELCQAKGFICEFCHSSGVLFPFQTAMCRRCTACKACFHNQCFKSGECPRCLRIAARRMSSEAPSGLCDAGLL